MNVTDEFVDIMWEDLFDLVELHCEIKNKTS